MLQLMDLKLGIQMSSVEQLTLLNTGGAQNLWYSCRVKCSTCIQVGRAFEQRTCKINYLMFLFYQYSYPNFIHSSLFITNVDNTKLKIVAS